MKRNFICYCICSLLVFGLLIGSSLDARGGEFFDDFNDGNADGWVFPFNDDLSQGPGLWSVVDGILVQSFFGDGNCGLVNNLVISDQVIEADMRTQGYAGVVLWYQQVNNLTANYIAIVHNYQTGMHVGETIDGHGYDYTYGGPWIGSDTYYHLRVVADSTSGELAVYVNDVHLFTHLAATTYRSGMSGLYSGNHFGYFDNFSLTSEDIPPVSIPVTIDIKPNSINPKSKGKIEVAILSTKEFNAPEMVDIDSLTFGRTGDEDSLAFCDPKPKKKDNTKGKGKNKVENLICHFYTEDAAFVCGDTEGVLKGKTVDDTLIEGRDSVRIVPCKRR